MSIRVTSYLLLISLFTSCIYQVDEIEQTGAADDFAFPESFDFSTSKTVKIQAEGPSSQTSQGIIDVYINGEDPYHLGKFSASSFSQEFTVPTIENELLLIYRDGSRSEFQIVDVTESLTVTWNLQQESNSNGRIASTESCVDRLYAVENSFGGFWEIDVTNETYTDLQLPNLQGGGSIACALDQANGLMYYNVGKTLYAYDVYDASFSTVHNGNPYNGSYPRLAFRDGLFYMSNSTSLYVVDAASNQVVNQYRIQGYINSNGGGDLDFTADGTLYLSCFSGLYKFTDFDEENGVATIIRISAENFPYQLTSMAIDRQDRIFVGTNDSNSKLIEMNKEDGSFRIVTTYDHKINDLTAWKCAEDQLNQQDSDNDGIIDELDDHPEDPDAAFDVYTPSEIGYGTLAFEDMWPAPGDYDFNDLVVNYRFANVMNANNESVRLEIELKVVAAGATFKNGFGIELPVDKSLIETVEGGRLTEKMITLDAKGLEANQTKAVIIPFDNALGLFNQGSIINTRKDEPFVEPVVINMTIHFTNPIPSSLLDQAPYNPFIFINGNRGREVHLKNQFPTALADNSLFGTSDDYSDLEAGTTYVDAQNVPWAINMIHNFRYPLEKTRIDGAYNFFVPWGKSSGSNYPDWYKDNSGYRNTNKIFFAP